LETSKVLFNTIKPPFLGRGCRHSILVNVSFLQEFVSFVQDICRRHLSFLAFIHSFDCVGLCSRYNLRFYLIRHVPFSLTGPHICCSIFLADNFILVSSHLVRIQFSLTYIRIYQCFIYS
jgi:hypothetical protein